MPKMIDMTGKQAGNWTVLRKDDAVRAAGAYWICRCSCGTVRPVLGTLLRNGGSGSCGCARREKAQQNMRVWVSGAENARRAKRGICYNVFCPQRDNYKGAWSYRRCHGCAGRETKRRSKREVLEI